MSTEVAAFLSLLVGLGAGALVARAMSGGNGETDVTVSRDTQGWHSLTTDQTVRLKRLKFMRWNIVEQTDLPAGARIELRFAGDNSPFSDRRPSHDPRPGRRVISSIVPSGVENGDYKYTVYLIDGANETSLEDPVIIIEGKHG
jgi:hypothetical protein